MLNFLDQCQANSGRQRLAQGMAGDSHMTSVICTVVPKADGVLFFSNHGDGDFGDAFFRSGLADDGVCRGSADGAQGHFVKTIC